MSPLSVLAAVALLLPLAPMAADRDAELPDGCREEPGLYVCEFVTSTRAGAEGLSSDPMSIGQVHFPVVAFARSFVTISIEVDATADNGWQMRLIEGDGEEERSVLLRKGTPSESPGPRTDADTSRHYIEVNASRPLTLLFWAYAGLEKISVADYRITFESTPASLGPAPALPAATADDPHVRDDAGDVGRAFFDVVAAWFDDGGRDDGLVDAHMRVADLSTLPTEFGPDEGSFFWDIEFDLQGARYVLKWIYDPGCLRGTIVCYAQAVAEPRPQWLCQVVRIETTDGLALTDPTCTIDVENSTLHAIFPESAIGSPGPGVEFTKMRVLTGVVLMAFGGRNEGDSPTGDGSSHEDETTGERFPFALGGPEVWCQYRSASCVAPAAWYEAPLAEEHVGNTMQALAILFAVGAFLFGFLLVRRRRARVKRLFDEVDAVVRQHPTDTRAGLLALGVLENDFDARYRSGKIHESEYQLSSQRIATAATRLSLRRDLGLDDGVPGDEPHAHGVRR